MSQQVFISYASSDLYTAQRIVERLEAGNISCWYADRNSGGELPYAQQISQAINECSCFIFILSDSSNKLESVHVRNEIDIAFNRKKNIICYRTINIKPADDLNYYLCRQKWIDGFGGSGVDELYATVRRAVVNPIDNPPFVRFMKKLWGFITGILGWAFIIFIIFAVILLIRDTSSDSAFYADITLSKVLTRIWSLIKNFDYSGLLLKIKSFLK